MSSQQERTSKIFYRFADAIIQAFHSLETELEMEGDNLREWLKAINLTDQPAAELRDINASQNAALGAWQEWWSTTMLPFVFRCADQLSISHSSTVESRDAAQKRGLVPSGSLRKGNSMSGHAVEVVQLGEFYDHPNADKLAIVQVFGFTVCVNKEDWKSGDLAVYIPPDSIVPSTPEYAFLNGHNRIRAKRLRGVVSFGLLMPAPAGAELGQDVANQLGITHYEPPLLVTMGDSEPAPIGISGVKFDIENLRRWPGVIPDGTRVQVTEKIHGSFARYTFREGRMWAGSKTTWRRGQDTCAWWIAAKSHPQIESFCRYYPGFVLYGEIFGKIQSLRYGSPNNVRFAAFDVSLGSGQFVDATQASQMLEKHRVPCVPMICCDMPYSFNACVALAEGPSTVPGADHVREGCVVKTITEKYSDIVGRVIFKVVGGGYLLCK